MHYYMYEIKNNISGKIYVGVHKTKNLDDGYMGSGNAIKAAIKKYGIENFTKTILENFDTQVEMFEREKEVVCEEFITRDDTYNLRRGGYGGFDHINDGSEEHISRARRGGISNGGGTKNWSEEVFEKAREMCILNSKSGKTSGWNHTEEWKKKASESRTGSGNGQFGTVVCLNQTTLERARFKANEIPDGWISTTEHEKNRLKKSSRRWFNNGTRNFMMGNDDPRTKEMNLSQGRIFDNQGTIL